MESHSVWIGNRSFVRNDEYETYQFVGELIGEWAIDYGDSDLRGVIYRVYRKEDGGVLIYTHEFPRILHEAHIAFVNEYDSLDEAAEDGFARLLVNMRVLGQREHDRETNAATYTLWRGTRSFIGDNKDEAVEVNGNQIGVVTFDDVNESALYRIIQTDEGRIIIHYIVRRGYEATGEIYNYASLADAAEENKFVLKKAGVI